MPALGSWSPRTGRLTASAGELESPGASVQDLLAAAVYRDVDGGDIPPDAVPMARALSSGESVQAEEIVVEASSGRCVTAIINATPVRNDDGAVESVIATVQDITALQELERVRVEFLGMVGHELRMPLSSIKGSAAALLAERSSLSSAEGGEYLRIIDEQADYMRGLLADLIDVVRIETGTLSVVPGARRGGRDGGQGAQQILGRGRPGPGAHQPRARPAPR